MTTLRHCALQRRCYTASPQPVPLHVTRVGPRGAGAPPVLFLHGLLGSSTNFRSIQHAVAASARDALAVDLRNHGKSPHVAGASSLACLADDVAAAVEGACGASATVDVVGHSLGGKVAMALSLARPGLVRRLVVMDIAPVAYNAASNPGWASVQGVVRAAAALQPRGYATRREVEAALAAAVPDPGVRSFVAQNLVPLEAGGFAWRVGWEGILASLPLFAGWEAPAGVVGAGARGPQAVHFVRGSASSYVLPAHEPAIRALFPCAEVHTVEGAGHWVHADKPAEFNALLAALLR
jgi:esterase